MLDDDRLAALREQVRAALDALPMAQRAAYLLCSLDGFDHDSVAFRLGLSVAQVEAALSAALVAIDQQISRGFIH
jgi:DNA-directed RNA polymerase specialized sigma24 family protein